MGVVEECRREERLFEMAEMHLCFLGLALLVAV